MDTFFLFISQNFIAFMLLILSIVALILYESRKGGTKLSPSEATRKINKEVALLIDVRPSQEFSSGHIAGSINVQEDRLDQYLNANKHPKEKPVVLVCRTGMNSKKLGLTLIKEGYIDINVIGGGMMTWEGSGMPLSK